MPFTRNRPHTCSSVCLRTSKRFLSWVPRATSPPRLATTPPANTIYLRRTPNPAPGNEICRNFRQTDRGAFQPNLLQPAVDDCCLVCIHPTSHKNRVAVSTRNEKGSRLETARPTTSDGRNSRSQVTPRRHTGAPKTEERRLGKDPKLTRRRRPQETEAVDSSGRQLQIDSSSWQQRVSIVRGIVEADGSALPVPSVAAGVREHVPLRPGFLAGGLVDLGTVGDAVTQTPAERAPFDAVHLRVHRIAWHHVEHKEAKARGRERARSC